ncbi:CPBP family intramembrane metalloprotease [Candidatus Thorarchaeota archaeon]|nr:MAG: CPBP family intramembrane metalloprotease [Candidatus Thorarchaeota archaeon]
MTIKEFVSNHALLVFIAVAYGLTWLIVLPLVLEGLGLIVLSDSLRVIHYVAPTGPALAAIGVTFMKDGRSGLEDIGRRLSRWRVGAVWLFVSVMLVWVFYLGAAALIVLMRQAWPDIAMFGRVRYLPYVSFAGAWVLWILTYGLGEETGWRGFLLPNLQSRYSALMSAILVSLVWALWHAPFFFYDANLQSMGLSGVVMWVIGMMFGSVMLTWLYNSTKGSILMVALWHGTYNLFTAAEGMATAMVATYITIFLMVLVVSVATVYKPANLSNEERQTAG